MAALQRPAYSTGVYTFAGLPAASSFPPTGPDCITAYTSDRGFVWSDGVNWQGAQSLTVAVAASRDLTAADNGKTLECTNSGLTLTVPLGLGSNFGCAIIPNGTTSIASSGGTLLNGATSTLTRAASGNAAVAIIPRISAVNSYVVTGS